MLNLIFRRDSCTPEQISQRYMLAENQSSRLQPLRRLFRSVHLFPEDMTRHDMESRTWPDDASFSATSKQHIRSHNLNISSIYSTCAKKPCLGFRVYIPRVPKNPATKSKREFRYGWYFLLYYRYLICFIFRGAVRPGTTLHYSMPLCSFQVSVFDLMFRNSNSIHAAFMATADILFTWFN